MIDIDYSSVASVLYIRENFDQRSFLRDFGRTIVVQLPIGHRFANARAVIFLNSSKLQEEAKIQAARRRCKFKMSEHAINTSNTSAL